MLRKSLNWIFRSRKGKVRSSDPLLQEVKELHTFLMNQLSPHLRSLSLQEFDQSYFSQAPEKVLAQLPALYLSYAQHTAIYKRTKNVRQIIASQQDRFPKLMQLPQFQLIFLPDDQQEVLLAKTFLEGVLTGAINILGQAEDHFFEKVRAWVRKLPGQLTPFEGIDAPLATAEFTSSYLPLVSQRIARSLEQKMGYRFTQRVYDRAYQEIADLYKLLNTFPIIISLIPQQFLNTEKIGLLTKHQLSATLLEKVNFLEELNQQLASRNTALQQAQEEVRKAQQDSEQAYLQLREVTNAVKDGIITADHESQIIMVNKEVLDIWGYQAEELIGQSLSVLMPEPYRSRHAEGMDRYLKTRQSRILHQTTVLEGLRKNGEVFPLEINISDLQFQGRHLFTAAVRDISSRIAFEKDLKASKALLELKTIDLEHAQEQLQRTIQDLKVSNQDLERFAYIASHDLQEPLRTVKGYLQLMKRKLPENVSAQVTEYLEFADLGVSRMEQLIRGLLEYARIGRKEKTDQVTPFADLMTIVTYNLQEMIRESGATLHIQPFDHSLRGNKVQLVQLFQNLISNGIKFSKSGQPPIINIRWRSLPDHWEFSVEDNGMGIAQENQEEIFEVFKRVHGVHQQAGAGIGLAICKKVVEQHAGEIAVRSIPGVGTEFIFTIAR